MSGTWSDEEIAGTFMERSLEDFVQLCEVYMRTEQRKRPPEQPLIDLLGDAIRLTRELTALQERHYGGRGDVLLRAQEMSRHGREEDAHRPRQ